IKHSANRFQSCPNEVIFGQGGMGKTFLMRKEVEKASKWMDYVFVFDSIGEYKHPSWKQIDPHEVATKQWEPGVYVINFYGYPHEKASALACSVLKKKRTWDSTRFCNGKNRLAATRCLFELLKAKRRILPPSSGGSAPRA